MIPGAMMWRNGYNVLLIDLRNHGESQLSPKYKYASYGNQEFRDVLGGLDYLTSTYPRLQNTTDQVGLMGVSMGGAVTAIAFAQQTVMNSLWLDAPALAIRQTLFYNVQNAKFDANFVFNAVTARASYAWPWGMPPFANDPLKAISTTLYGANTTRHVFYTHKLDDTFVPMFNSEQGMQLMTAVGYNVTSYFASDPNQNSRCNRHVDMYAYDPVGYERRMVAFFGDHLKFL
jgi:pimeloyl-ACP methyl ester carboxylesterase